LRSGALAIETWTGGLTTSFDRSQCVAILEAMERYAGVAPHGKSKPQRASFVALKEPKLDPARMTLYSADQYESPSFPCVRYSPQLELDWVWGWSFGNRTAIRIPEQFVYYDATRPPPGGRIVIESSNGCASGGSLEEAVFYGALEALERDAAMRTWYAMASPRRIDLAAMLGSELQLAVDRFHWVTGFELHALDITQEFAVPTIWMLAVGKHDGGYASISATKCHPDPLTAISGACFEIFGAFHSFLREYANKRSRMLKLCNEPDLLEEQLDHVYLAALPEAFSHYSFLLDGPVVAIDDTVFGAEPGVQRPRTLSVLFESILRVARDIAVVDMTTPEQRPWGMHSARVIIPELLPLTIGQRMRRTENSPRLAGLSRLNPWPHPFP
ncbi:MAG: YcaO-like family protein, partial [Alphaproteobacteria bacterium]|nr:YcaO-like family protein [Alphaproteobacteria bacterium]